MLKLQLLRLWWRCWNRVWFIVPGYWEWAWTLRCNGYRPIGEHLAQYCWRFSAHSGPCLAKITNERKPGAAWFWPDVRGPVPASNPRTPCLLCQRPVHLLRPPSGEYWAHDVHPVRRPHGAVPTNWQPCARCGRFAHLLMPHSSKFCKVTGRTDKHRPHWCCPQDCENDAPVFVIPLMAEADQEALDDPLPCICAAMNNPPCTACEMGLTDPDGEESA